MTESVTKNELIARIKVAAEALDIPADAIADVIKHGTNTRTSKASRVLCAFSAAAFPCAHASNGKSGAG